MQDRARASCSTTFTALSTTTSTTYHPALPLSTPHHTSRPVTLHSALLSLFALFPSLVRAHARARARTLPLTHTHSSFSLSFRSPTALYTLCPHTKPASLSRRTATRYHLHCKPRSTRFSDLAAGMSNPSAAKAIGPAGRVFVHMCVCIESER